MSFLFRIIIHIAANAVAILLADRLIPGFVFWGSWADLLVASAVLGIVNSFIRPVLKFLALPIIILTLGLFSLIINIGLLFFTASILPTIQISGFWAAFWAVIIISLTNNIIINIAKKSEIKNND